MTLSALRTVALRHIYLIVQRSGAVEPAARSVCAALRTTGAGANGGFRRPGGQQTVVEVIASCDGVRDGHSVTLGLQHTIRRSISYSLSPPRPPLDLCCGCDNGLLYLYGLSSLKYNSPAKVFCLRCRCNSTALANR